MNTLDVAQQIRLVSLAATQAVEEPDTITRHPEVVPILRELSQHDELAELFAKGNGHIEALDPAAYVGALSEALMPYLDGPLDDPELLGELALLASILQAGIAVA
jgi:hypothetical protein